MKEFDSFAGFATELVANEIKLKATEFVMLEKIGQVIEAQAKAEITHLQPETGPFEAWEPLAEVTIQRKEETSPYALNGDGNPGLHTGEMRDSYEHTVIGNTVHIGSDNDKAVWFELGTEKMPPRSVLGMAAVNKADKIVRYIGEATVVALTGGIINHKLGEAFQDRIGILNDD